MYTVDITPLKEIEKILSQASTCFVGIVDSENNPYVIPMNFGYKDNTLYLHSAQTGSCIDMLKLNNHVCITFSVGEELVYQDIELGCSYRMKSKSLICRGKVVFINDMQAKREALDLIMKHYTEYPVKYSDPAVRNVCIWQIRIENMTAKEYAAL